MQNTGWSKLVLLFLSCSPITKWAIWFHIRLHKANLH